MLRDENVKKFKAFFFGAEGDFALKQIDGMCSYGKSTFDPDPYVHAYKAGQMSIAVAIHALLELKEKEKKNA